MDEKFSHVPRSRLLTGEIPVHGMFFHAYEHNIPTTFPDPLAMHQLPLGYQLFRPFSVSFESFQTQK